MIKRIFAPMAALGLGLLLGSCAASSNFVADHWPHWAGGMPDDVPPRPGAPGYDAFIAHKPAAGDATTAAVGAQKTNVQAAPAGNPSATDQNAVQGGLY